VALIDCKCSSCGHVFETYRAAKDWPSTPACEKCQGPTEQAHFPKRVQWTTDPVIVFRAPDGTFRFPGDPSGAGAKKYERQGFERVELRGAQDVRRFEKAMNKHEFSRACRKAENKQQAREQREQILRSDLRGQMASMSPQGRALARAAMRMNDGKPREYAKEAGFVSEVYSFDSSNREASRDAQGRRRRD